MEYIFVLLTLYGLFLDYANVLYTKSLFYLLIIMNVVVWQIRPVIIFFIKKLFFF